MFILLCPQLFASGIYCKNSPTYDDLFGFDVDDVKDELRRGKRLVRLTAETNAQTHYLHNFFLEIFCNTLHIKVSTQNTNID